eukprot:GEMP01014457.1.p1 GENE.GEMP01014457.1~~GEMP01014457.1.p1  ORF type:complete len:528 (+),score=123.44 GEMP01014457.1:72-1586(+)
MSSSLVDSKTAGIFLAGGLCGALLVLARERSKCTEKSSRKRKESEAMRSVESMVDMSTTTWLHKEFHYSAKELIAIAKEILEDFHQGLDAAEPSADVQIPMIPSYVTKLPTGTEKGDFLALDMGGTNFRLLKINLLGDGTTSIKATKEEIPAQATTGDATDLFSYIAEKVLKFVPESVNATSPLPLGFTFSFPCIQTSLNHGVLLRWTKGFHTTNVVGCDVVALLQKELDARNIKVSIKAIVNDTVGTLMTRALTDKTCQVGLIIGTGCNAAYVERANRVAKYAHMKPEQGFTNNDVVIINTEMGNFSGQKLRRTRVDRLLDSKSLNPGEQFWEKMIAGYYLGELVRLVVIMFAEEGKIFTRNSLADSWRQKNSFNTSIMSQIEADEDVHMRTSDTILQREMNTFGSSLNDRTFLKTICRSISKRAARVAAAGVFAILMQLKDHKKVTVAVDGSVFKLYHMFSNRMRLAVEAMITESNMDMTVEIVDAEDGSGVGAAAVAASAC